MPTLNFPKEDKRSNGESFVQGRPWIKQNAELDIIIPQRRQSYYHCPVVHFHEAPENVTDLVSSTYIKSPRKK